MPHFRLFAPALKPGLCLPVMAQQVYRPTDADGNVVFSDTASPGSGAEAETRGKGGARARGQHQ